MFAQHISGHLCALNSAALKLAGIDRHTPDPAGGIIRRDADGEPDGVLEESPVYETIMPLLPTQTREQRIDDLAATTRDYAARGITTAVDAALFSYDDAELLRTVQEQGRLAVRVHVNPFTSLDPDDPRLAFDGKDVTIGGVKLLADGSRGRAIPATSPNPTTPRIRATPNGGAIPRTAARICSRWSKPRMGVGSSSSIPTAMPPPTTPLMRLKPRRPDIPAKIAATS